ncbi:MAG: penicillin-binding protein activator [Desulfurococcales archaeon]|nr:penicillin-binding protein activator [Desulfurococcales archaeon]
MAGQSTLYAMAVVALIIGIAIGYFAGAGNVTTTTVTQTQVQTETQIQTVTTTVVAGEGEVVTVTKTLPVTTTVTQTQTVQGQAPAAGLSGEVKIGVLLPLTGDLASYGEAARAAALLAEQDINAWLQAAGAPFTVKMVIEDTQTDPTVAQQKFDTLAAQGIKFMLGPMTSAEVSALKERADTQQILLISPSSTAPQLAIPDDFVFRFCPTDLIQGPAIAKVMQADGVEVVVALVRADDWGRGLIESSKEAFLEMVPNGVVEVIEYDPKNPNFAQQVAQLNDLVTKYMGEGKKVGVLLISFNEAVQVFQQADQYDTLKQVRWYGSDGTALLSEIVNDPVAGKFAAQVKFINPIFAAAKSNKYEDVNKRLTEELGRVPDTYAFAVYDAAWVVTLALMAVGDYDSVKVKEILPTTARIFYGTTGEIVLNEAGDRAFADYALWEVVETSPGQYEWVNVGMYKYASNSIEWYTG